MSAFFKAPVLLPWLLIINQRSHNRDSVFESNSVMKQYYRNGTSIAYTPPSQNPTSSISGSSSTPVFVFTWARI